MKNNSRNIIGLRERKKRLAALRREAKRYHLKLERLTEKACVLTGEDPKDAGANWAWEYIMNGDDLNYIISVMQKNREGVFADGN